MNKPISLSPGDSDSGARGGGTTTIIKEGEVIRLVPQEESEDKKSGEEKSKEDYLDKDASKYISWKL